MSDWALELPPNTRDLDRKASSLLLKKLGSYDYFICLPHRVGNRVTSNPNMDYGLRIAISEPRFRKDKEEIL